MTKVPPKVTPPAPRRPRTAELGRSRGAGSSKTQSSDDDFESNFDALTMGEKMQQEAELLEGREGLFSGHGESEHAEREEKLADDAALAKQLAKDEADNSKHKVSEGEEAHAATQAKNQKAEETRAKVLKDGFEGLKDPNPPSNKLNTGTVQDAAEKARLGNGGFGDAMKFLKEAKDPGIYFKRKQRDGDASDEQDERDDDDETTEELDADLAHAVQEAVSMLAGVRGIVEVVAGENEAGDPVVLVLTTRGFCESSMRAIPDQIRQFPTLVAVPYDVLPLRRM